MEGGIRLLGGSNMNDEYWRLFKEYKMSGMSTQDAMIRAHDAMLA